MDEGAWLTERAWKALRQCLKAGGTLRIYSTPNGLRDTTYYRLTRSSQFQVFRWPSWLHPSWNTEREAELLEFYGAKDSAGWQHEVAGEHGAPSYGAFNVEHLNLCRQSVIELSEVRDHRGGGPRPAGDAAEPDAAERSVLDRSVTGKRCASARRSS